MNAEMELLRRRLRADAILQSTDENPIRTRGGAIVDWMFYSWALSLTADGLALAARCLLDRLQTFESTQLATHGFTAMPLLSACILQGGGRYTGLAVRSEKKRYGSCRRIEGHGSTDKSVVLIDDSISSGGALEEGITALEAEGYTVEGAVCLVNFPYRGGVEWARALGYRIETLFDIWTDLEMPVPPYERGLDRVQIDWDSDARIEEGLAPAVVARQVAEHYARTNRAPLPPESLDRVYDARGGVFVSFRDRATEERLVRDGYWHFDPRDAEMPRDLVQATVVALQECPAVLKQLDRLKIGVSFLGPFEPIQPADLDYDLYGIAVRSHIYPKTGGALPNTQALIWDAQQYNHARWTNARVTLFEPHDLFRYTVTKHIEPGETWLAYGSPEDRAWLTDDMRGAQLLARARETIEGVDGSPLPDDLIPDLLHGVAVTLWRNGVAGCSVAWSGSLDDCVVRAARGALEDDRFEQRREGGAAHDFAISISLLHDAEHMGEFRESAVHKLRHGVDSLAARCGDKMALLLPYVAVHENLDKDEFAETLATKAELAPDDAARWTTLQTTTWLESQGRAARLSFGFPERSTMLTPEEARPLLTGYIARQLGADDLPAYRYFPTSDTVEDTGTAARVLHAIRSLALAARLDGDTTLECRARDGIARVVDRVSRGGALGIGDHDVGPMAECLLLLAMAQTREGLDTPAAGMLAKTVRSLFHRDGAISAQPAGRQTGADHDYLPGGAILALAHYAQATGELSLLEPVDAAFHWYRRRFRLVHPWGMVGWHPQAWSLLYELTGRGEYAEFAFEIADWALPFQHRKSGAFLSDLVPDAPSFHTGFLAEGIAAAWRLARITGDEREAAYAHSAREAWRFVQRLVLTDADTFCMPNPEKSRGGVRGSVVTSSVRIDFVSHILDLLIRFADAERTASAKTTSAREARGAMP